MHEYYMKYVASKAVLNTISAVTHSMKQTVLPHEALRVILNCSRELPWERVVFFLNDFMARVQFSGYGASFRYQILNSAFAAYDRMLKSDTDGSRPLHRPRGWNSDERVNEKGAKKVEWYKRGGYESVVLVPATPKSALQKTFKEALRDSGLRVRVVERAGHTAKSFLQMSDHFRTPTCGKDDCFISSTGEK